MPGVRYDRFSMDGDESDRIFLETLSPRPADFDADAVSSRIGAAIGLTDKVTVHVQYAGGFRAPPYSAINSGFTNLAGGYTSMPNPTCVPETSDNVEVGVRAAVGRVSFGVTGFCNFYDDFIQQVALGVNPATGCWNSSIRTSRKVEIRGLELRGEYGLAPIAPAARQLRRHSRRRRHQRRRRAAQLRRARQGVVGLEYAAPSQPLGQRARWCAAVTGQPAGGGRRRRFRRPLCRGRSHRLVPDGHGV